MAQTEQRAALLPFKRIRIWHTLIILIIAAFGLRLFYLQVIRYDHYKTEALSGQLKQYEVPATRGTIRAFDGDKSVPIVLNQLLYTIYADPAFIKQPDKVAATLANVLGGQPNDYREELTREGRRYVVLAKRVSEANKDKLLDYDYAGIGARAESYRVYPQGSLASQTLGFVNNAGEGVYGIEQALNEELTGTPGRLRAITDISGVPLAANQDNISVPSIDGRDVQMTLDLGIQKQMEDILKRQFKATKSKGLSAVIMETDTGRIKAMANYPTYSPAKTSQVKNYALFKNNTVSLAIEPGSSMKALTAAAALDAGVVGPTTTFYDEAAVTVNGYTIRNVDSETHYSGPQQQSIQSLLTYSLNTGAVWLLMKLGGTDDTITQDSMRIWHEYMTNHYRFGKAPEIEQGYVSNGYVPAANSVPAIELAYANTSFGQGLQVTALQMAAAYSSMLNGGTYYRPTLVKSLTAMDGTVDENTPEAVSRDVVNSRVSQDMQSLLEGVFEHHRSLGYQFLANFPEGYSVGGKTGSAQLAGQDGGYSDKLFNGTYAGFVGGNNPQYVIVVYNIEPNVSGYAGSEGAMPVFADLARMLIDGGYVNPKG